MSFDEQKTYFDADRPFYYAIVSGRDDSFANQIFSGRYLG